MKKSQLYQEPRVSTEIRPSLESFLKKIKEEILIYARDRLHAYNSGSVEGNINRYRSDFHSVTSDDYTMSGHTTASDWERYGHIYFLFGDSSPDDLRSAIRAYTKSIELDDTRIEPRLLLEEATQQLRRIEDQATAPKNRLPHHRKNDIRKDTYGKQPSAAEMSDKLRDAIRKGISAGEFIRREMIKPSGQKQEDIAEKINVHQASLSYVLNGRTSLSPEMAAKLSHHFQTYTTEELLTLQAAHDAKKADQAYLASLPEHKDPTPV